MAGKNEPLLPRIGRNPILSKSIWVGIFATIVAFLISGAINLTSLSSSQVMSGGFFATLITVFVIAEIVDVLAGSKFSRYVLQNLFGSILVALLLGTVLQWIGITTLTMNIVSGIGVLVGTILLFYIGALVIKKFVQ